MNEFHLLNEATKCGNKNRAFSIVNGRSESVTRKILIKAGYKVPALNGRDFWKYVQDTLSEACLNKTPGYYFKK